MVSNKQLDPQIYHKESNHIQLIRGQPTYFVLDLNLQILNDDKTNIFPVKNKIYNLDLLESYKQKSQIYGTKKQRESKLSEIISSLKSNDSHQKWLKNLRLLEIFVSGSNRFPSRDSCDYSFKNLEKLVFYVGSNELIEKNQ